MSSVLGDLAHCTCAVSPESGLCFDVKASISSVIKHSFCRYDLGKLEIDDLGNIRLEEHEDMTDVMKKCLNDRMPPLVPEQVEWLLKHEKTFTTTADVESVADLYKRFFDDVSSSMEELTCGT